MDKRNLSERDICTKFITPAVEQAGWDVMTQVREQVYFTKGRVIVRGKTVKRGEAKKADLRASVLPFPSIGLGSRITRQLRVFGHLSNAGSIGFAG